ncbi:hypothetical protein BD309DRAFT_913538 [Dichomitus squalens]|nr:hypothetical protein BD309DRAFT_913538 [Dichomitus squalens]
MDKTKSRLAAFFDNDEEETSFPQKEVDDYKKNVYTQGTLRKSKREKEKEAAEAKRKEEEENAAKAYAEFLNAFQGEGSDRKKGGSTFRSPSPPMAPPKPKGKRAMDHFLEEIKRRARRLLPLEQADREARLSRHATQGRSVTSIAAYEGQSGSKDRGDPETSNVFVANLPPHVNEQTLGTFFARAGPVGSVKIMWPRSDASLGPGADMTATRRNKNAGLSGFVSFMKRRDAEAALREFDGYDWGGSILRVGWSKAVPIAAKPMYGHNRRPGQDRLPDEIVTETKSIIVDRVHVRRLTNATGTVTDDEVTEQFLRTVASEVKGHDEEYETTLREREKSNPKYAFLNKDNPNSMTRYVRQCAYPSIGMLTYPQGYNSVYSTDSAEESERERGRKHVLGKLARRRFEAMLRALSGRRGEMARCMAFSLEHAEAAAEVADIIVSSLVVDGTPVPRKVARLHLICDILHNSAAPLPMAWKFRQEFQSRLGLVFDHLSTIYHSFPGRITAETFKKQITAVVDIWEDWIVFPPEYTAELRARLEGATLKTDSTPGAEQPATDVVKEAAPAFALKFKTSAFKPAEMAEAEETAAAAQSDDGEPMDEGSDVDGKPVDDVDGEPLDADVDGVPLDDVDGEPMEDVDGAPMDDVDGEPLGDGAPVNAREVDGESMEDIDGEPAPV